MDVPPLVQNLEVLLSRKRVDFVAYVGEPAELAVTTKLHKHVHLLRGCSQATIAVAIIVP